jgi:hypothetical protein
MNLIFVSLSVIDVGATFLDHFHDGLFGLRLLFDETLNVLVQQIPLFCVEDDLDDGDQNPGT